jgi:hypothetical protein
VDLGFTGQMKVYVHPAALGSEHRIGRPSELAVEGGLGGVLGDPLHLG